ncbi:MAG: alpha-ketoacid dehydrogenase subunit beta [Verrucomicrobia bacterium CG_4_10_14_3_um_filter_43_23]|nr:MAG: alpha-ketoacid dehydrogenase subunit beta [Verrucomicrobia bacterium CG1_02_43_26]PIP58988.1 MAG: alpha-ketoacid dehydrogenase subunit beta [Verrucomicrobia bacterium CG22_combo_CG10-13_8_21_14_all_43_17]PIX59086.1 MAG: alpha-ketoacid dehydrogenase subunit beta [Verrucomicrobia bacterium CG_4_10_14_3_um_filter_43_23]PIY61392.1 MAG: alpha-ketoacid dehydrogenase subunit beta [Verrucomicrobia bacterium CG_4_10_14_0_8_um_filter_43_34]PJA44174.1 MAG: alpha-ketoacid dehydrogenase subunit beta
MRELNHAQALREATKQAMVEDHSVVVMGEGVADPRGIFGTTTGLVDDFGHQRVIETPLSENAFTGMAIGMALNGLRPIVTHQRVDFTFLALDQMINNAAKWHFMFGGNESVPMVVRMVIGRGWGQGAQHSQSMQALYAHIPGLKVVMPVFADEAASLLLGAIEDPNPVIFIEHRWCHYIKGHVPEKITAEPLGKAKVVHEGSQVTIVAISYMVLEALEAAEKLAKAGISVEVINLRTIQEWDKETVFKSVQKTGRLVVADTGTCSFGVPAEIITSVCENCFGSLKEAPMRVASPDYPSPSSSALSQNYYPGAKEIAQACLKTLNEDEKKLGISWPKHHPYDCDRPNPEFQGPF